MTAHAGNVAEKQRIYTLASQWFMETLPEGGSILTPGKRIWTLEFLGVPEARTGGWPGAQNRGTHPDRPAVKSVVRSGRLQSQHLPSVSGWTSPVSTRRTTWR